MISIAMEDGAAIEEPEPEEPEPEEPEPEEPVDHKEQYLGMMMELQNYLLNKTSYSASTVAELDMNFDGKLDVLDLALLKRMIMEIE